MLGFVRVAVFAILAAMADNDWTRILGWPRYKVYRHELDERGKRLKLWARRKRAYKQWVCSGCGKLVSDMVESYEREVRDLPCFEYLTTVVVELYRVRCPGCGVRTEKAPLLPSKAPFSKRFEDAVGQACESAAASRVAMQFGLSASTVRAVDQRYLARWSQTRRKPALRQMGVDEIYLGKKQKFVTVVSNLDTGEPLWFGAERKKETLDEFFRAQLSAFQRGAVRAACVDMWAPFRQSIEQWLPNCRIVYDKFHILKHAGEAVNEVRRAEFFRMQTLQHLWRPGSTEKYPLDTPLGVYRESVWEFEPNAGRFCLHRNFGLPRWKSAPCGMNPRRQLVQIGEARISIAFLAVK